MNIRLRSVYLLAFVLIAAGCGREGFVGPRRTEIVTRSWPAAGIHDIRVFEVSGSVRVEAADTNEITLNAEVKGRIKPQENVQNKGLFTTELDGSTLRIGRHEGKRRFRFFFWDRNDVTISYVLKVPPSVSLDVKTVNGRIVTRGVEGETNAETVNGSIDVEVAGLNELSAKTVNGRVRAKFTRGFQGAAFKTINGGVEAILPNNASFSVDLAQVNGDFEAAFPLSIHSQPGSRRVSGEVNGGEHRLKIVTINGDVELTRLGGSL
jgi:putative adhesin